MPDQMSALRRLQFLFLENGPSLWDLGPSLLSRQKFKFHQKSLSQSLIKRARSGDRRYLEIIALDPGSLRRTICADSKR